MKYTAFALVLIGVMIAGFAGYQYFLSQPIDHVEGDFNSSGLALLLFGFGVVLMLSGAAMLAFGGKGYFMSRRIWRGRR